MEQKNIRNFAIIAHIDHGKSTLADRFLELTKTISKDKIKEQFLDQSPISRERGITIKLAPVSMSYTLNATNYTLNLIDTPGHIDFSYEVSRTLAACEGAILLVDATQGIQAQTVAHFRAAQKENLTIIPVINKIDLDTARIEETAKELEEIFGFKKEDVFYISAKTGQNVESLLKILVEKLPPPKGFPEAFLRALVFDAEYDEHRGVVAFIKVVDGKIKKDDKIEFLQNKVKVNASEVGYFSPFLSPKEDLTTGEIGYIVTGIKDIRQSRVGDTITILNSGSSDIKPLPGYETPKPMVFFGVYPKSTNELVRLKEGISKLSLNDASLSIFSEYSVFLGSGFRVGFLGLLHAEIFKERLKQEENINPILTMPHVLYEKKEDGTMLEPYMNLTIFTPTQFVGGVMSVAQSKKGSLIDISYHKDNAILKYEMPYSMFIRNLSPEIKTVSSGFASIDYEVTGYKEADLVNLEILINDTEIDVLSELVYSDEAQFLARQKTDKLKELIPRKQIKQVIQAKVGGKILSRSEIPPFRKDVLAKMSGGDVTRKNKLLEAQKKGKSKLFGTSKIDIPQEALLPLITKGN
jgi:GTP-binding protein LepA